MSATLGKQNAGDTRWRDLPHACSTPSLKECVEKLVLAEVPKIGDSLRWDCVGNEFAALICQPVGHLEVEPPVECRLGGAHPLTAYFKSIYPEH